LGLNNCKQKGNGQEELSDKILLSAKCMGACGGSQLGTSFKNIFCCGLQNLEEKSDYVSDILTSCRMKGRITFS